MLQPDELPADFEAVKARMERQLCRRCLGLTPERLALAAQLVEAMRLQPSLPPPTQQTAGSARSMTGSGEALTSNTEKESDVQR
jgi:hypothetical protein